MGVWVWLVFFVFWCGFWVVLRTNLVFVSWVTVFCVCCVFGVFWGVVVGLFWVGFGFWCGGLVFFLGVWCALRLSPARIPVRVFLGGRWVLRCWGRRGRPLWCCLCFPWLGGSPCCCCLVRFRPGCARPRFRVLVPLLVSGVSLPSVEALARLGVVVC